MCDNGHDDPVVDKFLAHDISGKVLIDLQYEDLKDLEIPSHTKRSAVMESIKFLRGRSRISLQPMLPVEMLSDEEPRSESPPQSRRGRKGDASPNDHISPGESISIVAIEQIMPKPHTCSKGENCKKWRKQQLKIQQIQEELQQMQAIPKTPMTATTTATSQSKAAPSTIASSAVFGPGLLPPSNITRERLSELRPVDRQENVRQFLGFQHMSPVSPNSQPLSEKLRNMPKLTIPVNKPTSVAVSPAALRTATPKTVVTPTLRRAKTPISAIRRPSDSQSRHTSFSPQTPADLYGLASPFSEMDVPVTSVPQEPLPRDNSQSVPPNMQYGGDLLRPSNDPISRPQSAQPARNSSAPRHVRHPSFLAPTVPGLPEEEITTPVTAISSSTRNGLPSNPRPRRMSAATPTTSQAYFSRSSHHQIPASATDAYPPRCSSVTPQHPATRSSTLVPPPTFSHHDPIPRASTALPSNYSYNDPIPRPSTSLTPPTTFDAIQRCSTVPPQLADAKSPSSAAPSSTYTHISTPHPGISPPSTSSSRTSTTSPPTSLSSSQFPSAPTISGPMRRRLRTKLLRHEWADGHFALTGTQLAMYRSYESYARHSKALDYIDIDDYAIASASAVSGKKLGSSFAKSFLLGRSNSISKSSSLNSSGSKSAHPDNHRSNEFGGNNSVFAFTLVPDVTKSALGNKLSKSSSSTAAPKPSASTSSSSSTSKENHYFTVKSSEERVEWMREIMIAKSLKNARDKGMKVEIDGVHVS